MPLHPHFFELVLNIASSCIAAGVAQSNLNKIVKSSIRSSTIDKRHIPCIFDSWEVATALSPRRKWLAILAPAQNLAKTQLPVVTATLRQCSSKLRVFEVCSWIPKQEAVILDGSNTSHLHYWAQDWQYNLGILKAWEAWAEIKHKGNSNTFMGDLTGGLKRFVPVGLVSRQLQASHASAAIFVCCALFRATASKCQNHWNVKYFTCNL